MLSMRLFLLQITWLIMCRGKVHYKVHVHLCHLPPVEPDASDAPETAQVLAVQDAGLPSGYVEYPEIGSAYKIIHHLVKWSHARKECSKHGRLAVIDTPQKLEYLRTQRKGIGRIWVGIHRNNSNVKWTAVDNSKISEFLPWEHVYRGASRNCLTMSGRFPGLSNWGCILRLNYACEILITPENVPNET